MGDVNFRVPFEVSESEFVEKRSRFISHLWPVETEEEAQAHIREMKSKYYDTSNLDDLANKTYHFISVTTILILEKEFYEWCKDNSVDPVPYNVITWLLRIKLKEILGDEDR